MLHRITRFSAIALLGAVIAPLCGAQDSAGGQDGQEQIPLEYFFMRAVVNNVQLSPDGQRLAMSKIPNRDGDPIIEVYETDDLTGEPFRFGASPMEINAFAWVSDSDLVINLRQRTRDDIEGFNQGVYDFKIVLLDIEDESVRDIGSAGMFFHDILPGRPDHIMVQLCDWCGSSDAASRRPRGPLPYYELNLDTGARRLVTRDRLDLANVVFDAEGNPLFADGYHAQSEEFLSHYRSPGSDEWRVAHRQHRDEFEAFQIMNLDYPSTTHALVLAHNGDDNVGLWTYNLEEGEFDELIYRRADADVYWVRYHSNSWANPDQVVGVSYFTDKLHVEYFDGEEGAMYDQLAGLIPHAHNISVPSRSRDGDTLVIYNVGPRDPGTFYLLREGEIQTIGSRQPLLDSEALADLDFIRYPARDGREIPAYVTTPSTGEAPWPLVVMPHGGPFVHEVVDYDEWAQVLASRGYMVLQPQYRGSQGYGLEFYTSAFRGEGGAQGGRKMQDDKDDGALYLVEQGLVDEDRIAMFGWSYGGYAALIAAARTPQIYQCVVAGAAVSDTQLQVNYYRYLMEGAQREEQLTTWDGSISPIDEVVNVNVPMLLIHGDLDQRVPVTHAERYRRLLTEHGKAFKYVELEGADHFSNTLFYDHKETLYSSLLDFLANDCGPNGL